MSQPQQCPSPSIDMVNVDDACYKAMEARLAACKKPKHFKGHVTDRNGVLNVVVYDCAERVFREKQSGRQIVCPKIIAEWKPTAIHVFTARGQLALAGLPMPPPHQTGNHKPRKDRVKVTVKLPACRTAS